MADLLHAIQIDASPKDVYAAFATQKGMRGWWTADTEMQEKVGGKADFGFDNRGTVFHMVIEALEADRCVRMSCTGGDPQWAGTQLEWKIEPKGSKTNLSFSHRNWRDSTPYSASCNSTWGELMHRLKAFAETGQTNPRWTR